MPKPIRILIAKPGLDGHDRGAKVIANVLRDAGMEVIYSGPRMSVEAITEAAIQEDVDVIGLSILSGANKTVAKKLIGLLRQRGVDIPVVMGGVIPAPDHMELKEIGVVAIFGQEDKLEEMVAKVREVAATRRQE